MTVEDSIRLPDNASTRAGVAVRLGALQWLSWPIAVGALCFVLITLSASALYADSYLVLAAGRYVAAHGIPDTEVFTTAAHGKAWIDQQWLAQWLYFQAWSVAGYAGLVALSSLLVSASFGLFAALLVRRGVPPTRAALWSLVAYLLSLGFTFVRAQSFSYPLFVFLLWVLLGDSSRTRFSSKLPVFLVPLLAVWSNLHGAAALGVVVAAAYCGVRAAASIAGRDPRSGGSYMTTAIVALGCLFANPYGFGVLDYYRALLGSPVVKSHVTEWWAPSFADPRSVPFIALLLAVVGIAGYGIGRGHRSSAGVAAITILLALAAMQAIRYGPWFAFAGAAVAAETLAHTRPPPPRLSPTILRISAAALAIAVCVATVRLFSQDAARFERLAPSRAVRAVSAYASAHPGALVLGDGMSASALLWHEPQMAGRLEFDGRYEQYSAAQLDMLSDFLTGKGEELVAATRAADVLIVSRAQGPELMTRLRALRGWRALVADRQGIALIRTSVES